MESVAELRKQLEQLEKQVAENAWLRVDLAEAEKSRDEWKGKAQEHERARATVGAELMKVKKSRDRWRNLAGSVQSKSSTQSEASVPAGARATPCVVQCEVEGCGWVGLSLASAPCTMT